MPANDLSPPSRAFLENLYTRTGDDAEAQISMYELGMALGLDREESRTTAEDLMAAGLLEIRTLSGGVALSDAGRAIFGSEDGGEKAAEDNRLGEASPMDPRQRELVEQTLTLIKADMGSQNLAYEALTEMIADVRTIEAQLTSPQAKTVVVRACLEGLRDLAAPPWKERLGIILG
ncbi:MAG: hypothetical protein QNI85_11685 [Desulfobacterales bacterium]|nr:hypothetical protein [Desulfobacterales bacterium]